ncbi:YdeI/OmpD-associated family protein [Candidatus Nomurabacteria bacterium]|nr:YdeI/OmpD-associated family protein [Candidatus Nomurabacteria bacterium]
MLKEKLHSTPKDLKNIFDTNSDLKTTWNSLTPLARNEWICWVTSAKKKETREKRINRMKADLKKGKRRPCCWAGCPHR